MKILILHLSDIHISESNNLILSRAKYISSCINEHLSNTSALFLVVSGDIAFSGKNTEYELAQKFLDEIISLIRKEKDISISVIMVPGNHDCDFSIPNSVRDAVLDTIIRDGEEAIDGERISKCIQVQKDFESFRKKNEPSNPYNDDPLWVEYVVEVDGKSILFDCLNVSWCSKIYEEQGKLVFPVNRYQNLSVPEHDLRIIILHHPLNWYKESTYKSFRELVRKSGDLIVSGHEHIQGAGEINDALVGNSIYIEGAALQSCGGDDVSGFNVIDINLADRNYQCHLFQWNGTEYKATELNRKWKSYRKLSDTNKKHLVISDEFDEILNNPGANFVHPTHGRNLKLENFYIYPDLEKIDDKEETDLVSAEVLQSPSSIIGGVLIKGTEKSGKTSLLHTLFQKYYDAGYLPLLLRGEDINSATSKELNKKIEKAVNYQYSKLDYDNWKKASNSKKIILFDDFERTKISDRYRWKVILFLTDNYKNLLITSDGSIDISEATLQDAANILSKFDHYEIRSFGHRLRHDLIRKWNGIDEDYTVSTVGLIDQIDKAEKVLNTVLGKNLVPRVPFYLLTLLQSIDSDSTGELQNSAFGHYYHYLLTKDLQETNVRRDEYGEFYGYCAKLAWFYHNEDVREIDENTLREFNNAYSDMYHHVNFSNRLKQLCKARWLTKRGEYYRFTHPYIYNYFLGMYLSENLQNTGEVRNLVKNYCDHLYIHEYANAILFLTHHSGDNFVIECVVEKLRSIFSESEPICLEEDTATLNDLVESTSKLVFSDSDPESNRRKAREVADNVEQEQKDEEESPQEEIDGELDLPSRLNMLFKTVNILGQILKNHYGRIENTKKVELMREVYRGPLRALRGFLEAIEGSREAIILEIEASISSKIEKSDKSKQNDVARQALFSFIGAVTYGFLFKASSAVGSEHLRNVARQLVQETPSMSFRLIDLSNRLDAQTALPFGDIKKLSADSKNNIFAHRLLETIVLRYLYFYKTSEQDRQKVCQILGVPIVKQQQLEMLSKSQKK